MFEEIKYYGGVLGPVNKHDILLEILPSNLVNLQEKNCIC